MKHHKIFQQVAFMIFTAVCFLSINTGLVHAQFGMDDMVWEQVQMELEMGTMELNLSPEQEQQIHAFIEQSRKNLRQQQDQLMKYQDQLAETLRDVTFNENTVQLLIRKIENLQSQITQARFKDILALRKMFTKEELNKLRRP